MEPNGALEFTLLTADLSPPDVALCRMVMGDTDDRITLAANISASMFAGGQRVLWELYTENAHKGHSAITIRPAVERAGCLKEHEHVLNMIATAGNDDASIEALIESVNEYGKKQQLIRAAREVERQLACGGAVEDVRVRLVEQAQAIGRIGAESDPRFRLLDDQELESQPQPEWLIPGMIPQDALVTVVGQPGGFKTFFVTDLCFHIRAGMEWNGRQTTPGDVVYLCGEGASGIKQRTAAWKNYYGVTGRVGVHFLTNSLELNEPADVAGVVKTIEAKGIAPKLIVIDTLSRFLAGNESTAEDMGSFIRGCDELRRQFGCTVIVVHHPGKDALKGARGSSALYGAVDTEIVCQREEGEMRVELICTKQKDAPEFGRLALEAVAVSGSLVLIPSGLYAGRMSKKNAASLLALYEADVGSGLTHAEWMEASDQPPSTFNKGRNWLRANSYVKVEEKKYSLTDAGRAAIQSTRSTGSPSVVHSHPVSSVHSPGVCGYPGVNEPRVGAAR